MLGDDFRDQARKAAEEAAQRVDLEAGGPAAIAQVLKIFAAHDLLTFGFSNPAATGPQAGDMRKACTIMNELAFYPGGLSTIYSVSGILTALCVSYNGSPEQKAEMLPKVAAGKLQLAFALTEPGAGSDAAGITTRASVRGNDTYLVEGEKIYTTGAMSADIVLVIAKTSSTNPKSVWCRDGPRGAENMTIEPLAKMAGNNMPSCKVTLAGVAVPAANILGGAAGLENAWQTLRHTGSLERLAVAASACGMARAATARATEFIRERRAFGKTLKEFQSIQHLVVEMATLTRGMELFAENAMQAQESGEDPTQAISMAKYFCSEQLQRVVEIAVRVLGGRAYFDFRTRIPPLSAGPLVLVRRWNRSRSRRI